MQIRLKEPLGLPECPYLFRWYIILFDYSIRIHHWIASDDLRYKHDHPWWMLIFILKGGYIDNGDKLSVGSIRFRKASYKHSVKVNPGGCWSLLITGKSLNKWGFWVGDRQKRMRPLRYFSRYGHPPCE